MATGGIFQIITNDGKQDRMLMATGLLNMRLKNIERQRARNSRIRDPTPTLVDIEKTHILFVNAHFKPFAAMAYEYNKVAVQSGSAQLNSTVEFSIPQFGDFFNDMALHVVFDRVSAVNSAYWTDPSANPANGQELVRYVDFVGQRLCKKVEFRVNGNPLDEYDSEVMNMHQKFRVQPNKEVGWNRNVGQELPLKGYSDITFRTTSPNLNAGAGMRQELSFLDGPQTPKPVQEQLEMWIPLLFWFNLDPRLSIPSVSIPYGQRFIDVTLASQAELLQSLPGDNGVYAANLLPFAGTVSLSKCELWINNIFVNPEIHDIFIKRIGFNLIRVHRRQYVRVNKSADNLLLNQMKWPIETMYIGLRPTENVSVQNPLYPQTWNLYGHIESEEVGLCAAHRSIRLDVATAIYDPVTFVPANLAVQSVVAVPPTVVTQSLVAVNVDTNVFHSDLDGNYYVLNVANGGFFIENNYTYAQLNNVVKTTDLLSIDFAGVINAQGWAVVDPNATANMTLVNLVLNYLGYPTLGTSNNAASMLSTLGFPRYFNSTNCDAVVLRSVPVFRDIEIEVHGIPLYKSMPATFFNSYVPYTFGGHNIRTPNDNAVHMINFCLYPGAYQPSGHINISRAREFYLNFVAGLYAAPDPVTGYVDRANPATQIIDNNHTGDLVVIAIALNFLLISDGSAILRYST